ncbi:7-carboxy-7-deazaguanine synthase [Sporomusa carbonis]|uniref:7-carboxy-7-deazaguanine synthase QueE n=1 Tax=Sporomusa carbonis TaxID=3076075 RepID=UPI003A6942AD
MAHVVEVFSSIQGEGLYVGTRQVFVRFAGCNLACTYCDTPDSRQLCQFALVERTAGKRNFISVSNPLSLENLVQVINSLLTFRHHSISFTGGEPLCQAASIIKLAPQLNAPIYLETNGTLPDRLAEVLPYVDIISMDIKLPSIAGKSYWQEHYEFLRLALDKEVFVKVVVTGQTKETEIKQAVNLVASVSSEIPLILQPVTPINGCEPVTPETLLMYQEHALAILKNVRVIPQTHKFMGQL